MVVKVIKVKPVFRVRRRTRLKWWWRQRRMSPELRRLTKDAAKYIDERMLFGP